MLKIGPLVIISTAELDRPENDLVGQLAALLDITVTTELSKLNVELSVLRAAVLSLRPAAPEQTTAATAATTTPAETNPLEPIARELVAACQAADAYLHTWPGPLPPEARPLCDQLVDAIGNALLALREAPNV